MTDPVPPKRVFQPAREEAAVAAQATQTPQTVHPAYRLAFQDMDFLLREDLRPVRFQLELLKPELLLDQAGIAEQVGAHVDEHEAVVRRAAACGQGLQGDQRAVGLVAASGAMAAGAFGVDKGLNILVESELLPYASYYLTGFLQDRPLARLRGVIAITLSTRESRDG